MAANKKEVQEIRHEQHIKGLLTHFGLDPETYSTEVTSYKLKQGESFERNFAGMAIGILGLNNSGEQMKINDSVCVLTAGVTACFANSKIENLKRKNMAVKWFSKPFSVSIEKVENRVCSFLIITAHKKTKKSDGGN